MSKKAFKSQASSSRAVSGAFGAFSDGLQSSGLGGVAASPLSHVYEPPDLSGLSDPNVVVAFKNLQKKDSTTKSKALEDLQAYVQTLGDGQNAIEEATLESWIKVYPRTSIDNSRRVRQLAHTLQGQIAISCGKRIAKYMPQLVGAWLAGLYDNDKSVSRAAQESFKLVFPSEEKYKTVWVVYQSEIVLFCKDIVEKETVNTLSDERTTSPDDAASKYSRTLAAVLTMISNLIDTLPDVGNAKCWSELDDFLLSATTWGLASYGDASVRRSIFRVLDIVLVKRKGALDAMVLSSNVLTSALHTNQMGSSLEYVKAVSRLSAEMPSVWTESYRGTGKKCARSRLCYFLQKGSRNGPADFWKHVAHLLKILPAHILIGDSDSAISDSSEGQSTSSLEVLDAMHEGISHKDEPRSNSGTAWQAYLMTSKHILASLKEESRFGAIKSKILPLLSQHIRPSYENTAWSVVGSESQSICVNACLYTIKENEELFLDSWRGLSSQIVEDMKTSLPEQSKDYVRSQDSLAAETGRWYALQSILLKDTKSTSFRSALSQALDLELEATLTILKNRNGKPYGAAASLDKIIQLFPDIILANDSLKARLHAFANEAIPQLVLSPSAKYLIHSLDLLQWTCDVSKGIDGCTNSLAEVPMSPQRSTALRTLLASSALKSNESLALMASKALEQAISEDGDDDWKTVGAVLGNIEAPKQLIDDILATLTVNLSLDQRPATSSHGLEILSADRLASIKEFSTTPAGSSLIPKLLFLADNTEGPVKARSQALSNALQSNLLLDGADRQVSNSSIKLIRQTFEEVTPESLSMTTINAQAKKSLEQCSQDDKPAIIAEMLPSPEHWAKALAPFICKKPNPSLAVTNSFGGAVELITEPSAPTSGVPYDSYGHSLALRIASFVVEFAGNHEVFASISESQRTTFCISLALLTELAGDNISVQGCMPLWNSHLVESDNEVVDLVATIQGFMGKWLHKSPGSGLTKSVRQQLFANSEGRSPMSYYHGRAYSSITSELYEKHGQIPDESQDQLKGILKSEDHLSTTAILSSAPECPELLRLCNELLAELTGHNFKDGEFKSLRYLVFLNNILQSAPNLVEDIPQQRLVFFVKHIVEQMQTASMGCQAEILRALKTTLPCIKAIYGSFWDTILAFLEGTFSHAVTDDRLPRLAGSLRLLFCLQKEDMQSGNDDLLDSWTDHRSAIGKALVGLVGKMKDLPDTSHQPRRIINDILGRQLGALKREVSDSAEELYPALAAESEALQTASFEVLHCVIPARQEQMSLEKALEKSYDAKLPEELLSLILAAPSADDLADVNLEQSMPSGLRSYLLSWKLVVDHWTKASVALQADYAKNLQEGTYIPDLLNLASNFQIAMRHKPVDASKYSFETYTPSLEPPEKEFQWLLIHLYYLVLTFIPSPAKAWWRDTTSRQTSIAVQAWTEKYISPLIISTELSAIKDWAPSQESATESPLTVKVSQSTREITASIPIDEQATSISIRLPASYPLSRAEVTGVHRVGVPENKWQSWIRNAQGQLTISDGGSNALIDCLLAWRRNVTASMKGQTECAICYSVIGADKTLPKKECPTCKNRFHAGCLFRWFKSSNSSSCPLCRNTFAYS